MRSLLIRSPATTDLMIHRLITGRWLSSLVNCLYPDSFIVLQNIPLEYFWPHSWHKNASPHFGWECRLKSVYEDLIQDDGGEVFPLRELWSPFDRVPTDGAYWLPKRISELSGKWSFPFHFRTLQILQFNWNSHKSYEIWSIYHDMNMCCVVVVDPVQSCVKLIW